MRKIGVLTMMLIAFTSICFAETTVEALDLIGKWRLVKRACPGYEETNSGKVEKIFYNDEEIMVSMVGETYKDEYSPTISSYTEEEFLLLNASGDGAIQRDIHVNGKRAILNHSTNTWEYSSDLILYNLTWTFENKFLTIESENESVRYPVSWIEEENIQYLLIESLGMYIK